VASCVRGEFLHLRVNCLIKKAARMVACLARTAGVTSCEAATPCGADAMRLLERVAIRGIKFPGSLIMLSKAMFTLEGILGDIVGSDNEMGLTVARHVAQHWLANRSAFRSPLGTRAWLTLQCSALLYTCRWWVHWEQATLDRLLTPKSAAIRLRMHDSQERTLRGHELALPSCTAMSLLCAADGLLWWLDK
jgi:hypothetical protein